MKREAVIEDSYPHKAVNSGRPMKGETSTRFKIIEKIGRGGMGVVHKAWDNHLNRTVALKFLKPGAIPNPETKKRFEQEARAAAALNHPNIVTIHDINLIQEPMYIVMEYVEGQTLWDIIHKKTTQSHVIREIPLPPESEKMNPNTNHHRPVSMETRKIIDYAIQVCHGLKAAHQKGIIHRDIKSQNIMIKKDDTVKILDFGLAKPINDHNLTNKKIVCGTPHYMSPEHLTGKELDQRTDIWSLGVVLYEMLTTEFPFYDEDLQLLYDQIIEEDPIPPSYNRDAILPELDHIVLKCLRKVPNDRYHTVERLLADLEKIKEECSLDQPVNGEIIPVKERRFATVLSAEISGYKKMLEVMDPEEVDAIMSDCFAMFTSIIAMYEGRLVKITGNSFMVPMGVPAAVENASEKAVKIAVEMRSQLEQFNKERGLDIPLGLSIGINSGIVIARFTGNDERSCSVMGSPVELADRLKDMAAKDTKAQIYVGPFTHRYTKNEFKYKKLKLPVGKDTAPMPVYKYLYTIPRDKLPGVILYSEMVGREQELNKLHWHLADVIDNQGWVVNIIGEAGIGKSRLVAEFKKNEDFKKVTLLRGRALSIGKNLSYYPIIDAIKQWAKIEDKDSAAETENKLERKINHIDPVGGQEIFPFIATLMGMKLTGAPAQRVEDIEGEALENLIKKSFCDLIIKMTARQPVVFILEDLHWADLTSVDLLESLYRLAQTHPILFINVFRPGHRKIGERLLKTIEIKYRDFHTEIYLQELDQDQSKQLISGLLKNLGLPGKIVDQIILKTGGNPFFIEEVLRSFIDDGFIEHKKAQFRVTKSIEAVVIPETIKEVVKGRIDKLESTTRSLVNIASIMGRNFFYKVLEKVAKGGENGIKQIDEPLEFLKDAQLIKEKPGSPEEEYIFIHVLVQEVAYESILVKERKDLHLQVAAAIESVFAQKLHEFYGMLACHYSKGGNREKAEKFLIKAGDEAKKAGASYEALHYFQEALKLYREKAGEGGSPETNAKLLGKIADAFYNKGKLIEAVEYFDQALELRGEKIYKNKIRQLFNLAANLSSIIKTLYFPSPRSKKIPGPQMNDIVDLTFKRGTSLATVDNYRMFMHSVGLLRKLNKLDISKVVKGVSMYIQGSTLFSYSGVSFKISKKLLEYSWKYIHPNDRRVYIDYKFSLLLYAVVSGNWAEGSGEPEFEEKVYTDSVKMGDLWSAIVYLFWIGLLQIERGNFAGVRTCVEKLQKIGDHYDHDFAWARGCMAASRLLLKCRKLEEALREVDAGITFPGNIGGNLNLLNFTGTKANIQLLLGDIQGAAQSLERARAIVSKETRVFPFQISSFHLSQFLYDIYLLEKSIDANDRPKIKEFRKKAYLSGKTAVKTADKYAPNQTETYRLLGVYYWLMGKRVKALTWFKKSLRKGEQLGAWPEYARTCMEMGKRLLDREKRAYKPRRWVIAQAERYLGKAQVLFREMALHQDLKELNCLSNH
jgi:serine/threonine protein kinase/tetratricopeptide (TPR) repeat protein